jgi:hypothetical protein
MAFRYFRAAVTSAHEKPDGERFNLTGVIRRPFTCLDILC